MMDKGGSPGRQTNEMNRRREIEESKKLMKIIAGKANYTMVVEGMTNSSIRVTACKTRYCW